jgi:Cu+-exporting ATPase
VVRAAEGRGLAVGAAQRFEANPGRGVAAEVDGLRVVVGNRRLMDECGADVTGSSGAADRLARDGRTVMYVAVQAVPRSDRLVAGDAVVRQADSDSELSGAAGVAAGDAARIVGVIGLADTPRPEAAAVVRRLSRLGLRLVVVSGDHRPAVEAVVRQVAPHGEIERVVAGVLPDRKVEEVAALRREGRVVAMVGDGINDAPALAGADVGMAIGSGTDVAIEAADVTLVRSDLNGIADAIRLSRRALAVIRQNLFWAFAYNALGIPLAAGVFYPLTGWMLNPMAAAAAMSLSSVSVVTNSLRLRRA